MVRIIIPLLLLHAHGGDGNLVVNMTEVSSSGVTTPVIAAAAATFGGVDFASLVARVAAVEEEAAIEKLPQSCLEAGVQYVSIDGYYNLGVNGTNVTAWCMFTGMGAWRIGLIDMPFSDDGTCTPMLPEKDVGASIAALCSSKGYPFAGRGVAQSKYSWIDQKTMLHASNHTLKFEKWPSGGGGYMAMPLTKYNSTVLSNVTAVSIFDMAPAYLPTNLVGNDAHNGMNMPFLGYKYYQGWKDDDLTAPDPEDWANSGASYSDCDAVPYFISCIGLELMDRSPPQVLYGNSDWTDDFFFLSTSMNSYSTHADQHARHYFDPVNMGVRVVGSDYFYSNKIFDVAVNKIYTFKIRLKVLAGNGGRLYVGVVSYDVNGRVQSIHREGDHCHSFNYGVASGLLLISGTEVEYVGAFSGFNVPGACDPNKFDPDTSFFGLAIIPNYPTSPLDRQVVVQMIELKSD